MRTFTESPSAAGQRGVALITSVMLLVIITLLALSMFKSFGIQERLAGNTLEKQRSFQAAQSVLQYGEWWLANSGVKVSDMVTCSANVDATTDATKMRLCDALLPDVTTAKTFTGVTLYKPGAMTVATGGGKTAGNDVNYAGTPALHIGYLGTNGSATLFQVTGIGYGGTSNSMTVVQSVFSMTSKVDCKAKCAPI